MNKLIVLAMLLLSCSSSKMSQTTTTESTFQNNLFRNDAIELARKYLENRNEINNFHYEPIKVTEEPLHFYVFFKRKLNVRPQQIKIKVNKKTREIEKVDSL